MYERDDKSQKEVENYQEDRGKASKPYLYVNWSNASLLTSERKKKKSEAWSKPSRAHTPMKRGNPPQKN